MTLPVPEGESVSPESNVFAWGHGDLTGNVKFNDDGESNFRSFVDGYNAGVAYYFGQAGG